MKRLLVILMTIALSFGAAAPGMGETETVYSYDFDFTFHLEPSVFTEAELKRVQGYADLLEMLEIRGRWTYCEEYKSLDTEFSVIPVTNPDAAVSCRIYGFTSHLLLTSPLLGDQTILFNNEALMEFCLKTYEHLGLPLPYLALLHPYSFYNAFYYAVKAWEEHAAPAEGAERIPAADLRGAAEVWEQLLTEDNALLDWFSGLSLGSEQQETLMSELHNAPWYITNTLTGGKDIRLEGTAEDRSWIAGGHEALRLIRQEGYSLTATSLPATESGYRPDYFMEESKTEETTHMSLLLSYAPDPEGAGESSDAVNLLTLMAEMNWPSVWPAASVCQSSVSLTGELLPNFHFNAMLTTEADGAMTLDISLPSKEASSASTTAPAEEVADASAVALSIRGRMTPRPEDPAPWFEVGELIQHLNIFSVNDVTLNEFVHRIARSFATGMLNFLVEVPASACQSVMDDLTDYGVLSVILGD